MSLFSAVTVRFLTKRFIGEYNSDIGKCVTKLYIFLCKFDVKGLCLLVQFTVKIKIDLLHGLEAAETTDLRWPGIKPL